MVKRQESPSRGFVRDLAHPVVLLRSGIPGRNSLCCGQGKSTLPSKRGRSTDLHDLPHAVSTSGRGVSTRSTNVVWPALSAFCPRKGAMPAQASSLVLSACEKSRRSHSVEQRQRASGSVTRSSRNASTCRGLRYGSACGRSLPGPAISSSPSIGVTRSEIDVEAKAGFDRTKRRTGLKESSNRSQIAFDRSGR
jgi:hypothetical protein